MTDMALILVKVLAALAVIGGTALLIACVSFLVIAAEKKWFS